MEGNVADLERAYYNVSMAARTLIDDVMRRYPGEALRCPYMIALDDALKELERKFK